MLDINKKTLQTHPSLLPLRMALTAAERESPARPPHVDSNEQRALQLIKKIKSEYQKPLPFTSWKEDAVFKSFRLQEVIRSDAR